MSKDKGPQPGKGFRPLGIVLLTLYLVLAAGLAHTAFVTTQGRATAVQGLEASSSSALAFSELKEQIVELKKQLYEAQHGAAAATNASSTQLQQHLQQLKQELAQDTTKAYASLLQHAVKADERFNDLQNDVTSISSKLKEPAAVPSGPAPGAQGVTVEEKELHHVVTHVSVCDKGPASQGLSLNVTDGLIAPLVVVAHNRPGYLTKTMLTLLK